MTATFDMAQLQDILQSLVERGYVRQVITNDIVVTYELTDKGLAQHPFDAGDDEVDDEVDDDAVEWYIPSDDEIDAMQRQSVRDGFH